MQYQTFDYLVALHYRLSPENDLVELSWVIINTRMLSLSEVIISQIIPTLPSFQMHSFEHIVSCLFQTVTNIEKDLRSVAFVTFKRNLFENILSVEAIKRNIILPSLFCNFIPINESYQDCQSIVELADKLGERIQVFQHDIVIFSRCCLALLNRNHNINKLVYVDRLNKKQNNLVAKVLISGQDNDSKFYKLRGLPFKVSSEDIINFLEIQELQSDDIEYQFQNHKFTGTAWVRAPGRYSDHIQSKHQKHMANRYIQISKVSKLDFMKAKNQNLEMREKTHRKKDSRSRSRSRDRRGRRQPRIRYSSSSSESCRYTSEQLNNMGIVKMRGLPFDVTTEQILNFFGKYNPISHSLKLGYNGGRKTGDAVILFSTRKQARQALELDRQRIGSRYIELITISSDEFKRFR